MLEGCVRQVGVELKVQACLESGSLIFRLYADQRRPLFGPLNPHFFLQVFQGGLACFKKIGRRCESLICIFIITAKVENSMKHNISLLLFHSMSFSLWKIGHSSRLAVFSPVRLLPRLRLFDQLQLRLRRFHVLRHLSVSCDPRYLEDGQCQGCTVKSNGIENGQ